LFGVFVTVYPDSTANTVTGSLVLFIEALPSVKARKQSHWHIARAVSP
jgi:hypothetical protein